MKIESTTNIMENKYTELKYLDDKLEKYAKIIINGDEINKKQIKDKIDELISNYPGDIDDKKIPMFLKSIIRMGHKKQKIIDEDFSADNILYSSLINKFRLQNASKEKSIFDTLNATLNATLNEKSVFTTFVKANLQKANLNNCDLREVDLRDVNLRGASLVGSKLSGKNLSHSDLRDTDLREADLRNTDLREANLSGAILIRAKLNSANLSNANLMEVDLREANLIGSRLIGANLSKANLKGAIR